MKLYLWVIIAAAVVCLTLGVFIGKAVWDKDTTYQLPDVSDSELPEPEIITKTVRETIRVASKINDVDADVKPDPIDSLYHEAFFDTTLVDQYSSTYLMLKYSTRTMKYNIDWATEYYLDSTYVENTVYVPVVKTIKEREIKPFRGIVGGSYLYSFDTEEPIYGVNAGVSLWETVDIIAGVYTNRCVGINLCFRF